MIFYAESAILKWKMALNSDTKRKLAQISREAEERDAKKRAASLGYPYIDLSAIPIEIDSLALVAEDRAKAAKLAVLAKKRQKVEIAAYNPQTEEAQKILKEFDAQHLVPEVSIGSLSGLTNIWNFYQFVHKEGEGITGKIKIDSEVLSGFSERLNTLNKIKAELQNASEKSAGAGQFLEIFLAAALTLHASDIHLEPEEHFIKFRLRIDGLLHDVSASIKKDDYNFVISRIKLLSGLKLNIHQSSQDGRFTTDIGKKEIELRVSILPSEYGETAVLRILDPEIIKLELKDLGLRADDLDLVQAELSRPNGMILNTGPTGSGKTTTLYAFLLHVKNSEIKIITIENPIEYRLEGIEQTQIDEEAGYTFENGLRAIVRQDPDIILVGEIRDYETAEIAMHASLTGHLVFSTLHTNDSFGAIPRLVDLGVKASVIGPSLNLIIAQRLVRKVCEHCRAKVEVTPELKDKIRRFFNKLSPRVNREQYKEHALYKAVGCEACGNIGYKGRIAIFELLKVDDQMEELIHKDASEVKIKEVAKAQNIVLLQQDGILKSLLGVTTLEEVVRISGPIEWPV